MSEPDEAGIRQMWVARGRTDHLDLRVAVTASVMRIIGPTRMPAEAGWPWRTRDA